MKHTAGISVILWILLIATTPASTAKEEHVGLIHYDQGAFHGYTLLSPLFSTSTYLIDMEGRVVNEWENQYTPGQSVYLLKNGHLLRTANPGPGLNSTFHGGGSGGKVQEFAWDGRLVWEFTYSDSSHMLHHDIEPLPNGNILMLAWVRKDAKEAAAAGRNPEKLGNEGLWSEQVIEVQPQGKTSGKIVWEWNVWDHLVQEFKKSLPNYGKAKDRPGRIDINPFDWKEQLSDEQREKLASLGYLSPSRGPRDRDKNPDWLHINAVAYNADLDQIVLSVLGFNEIWIIDHAVTTKEAAGPKGDLLFRYGNPQAFGAGTPEDQQLFAQHDAHWIAGGLNGAGHLLVFNNGRGRPGGDYSSVDELLLFFSDKGYGQSSAKTVWSYTAPEKKAFFSTHISGAQRLPNGNTLICSGANGTIFEVTAEGKKVWEYVNPLKGMKGPPPMGRNGGPPGMKGRPGGGPPPGMDKPERCLFRAYRYGPDYGAFEGKKLKPGKKVEELAEDIEG